MMKYIYYKFLDRLRTRALRKIFSKFKDYTMIPEESYLINLKLANRVRALEGCVVECGVWRGGMIAGIADCLGSGRKYYLFDSFEGLPEAQQIDGKSALEWQNNKDGPMYYNNCRAPKEYAQSAMERSGASNFTLEQGWFQDTLPLFPRDEKIALLRLDADWYSSTQSCLDNLFGLVVTGGLIILDDYYAWDGCRKALHDFLSHNSRSESIESIGNVCFLVKRDDT